MSTFNDLHRCCVQQWGLSVSLWGAINSLGNSLGLSPMWLLWPATQLDVTQPGIERFICWNQISSLGMFWQFYLCCLHICTCIMFPYHPANFLCLVFLVSHFCISLHLIVLLYFPIHLNYFLSIWISIYPTSIPYFVSNFSGVINCILAIIDLITNDHI